jgi:hypothetical protein
MKYVTMGWDGLPTLLNEDGTIYPRKAELIFHKDYYPNWPGQAWPIDPKTGEKCPIENKKQKRAWQVKFNQGDTADNQIKK